VSPINDQNREIKSQLSFKESEVRSLASKCETLEKKVDSLVKFLETERNLRH
jgi:hypothetical protein